MSEYWLPPNVHITMGTPEGRRTAFRLLAAGQGGTETYRTQLLEVLEDALRESAAGDLSGTLSRLTDLIDAFRVITDSAIFMTAMARDPDPDSFEGGMSDEALDRLSAAQRELYVVLEDAIEAMVSKKDE